MVHPFKLRIFQLIVVEFNHSTINQWTTLLVEKRAAFLIHRGSHYCNTINVCWEKFEHDLFELCLNFKIFWIFSHRTWISLWRGSDSQRLRLNRYHFSYYHSNLPIISSHWIQIEYFQLLIVYPIIYWKDGGWNCELESML